MHTQKGYNNRTLNLRVELQVLSSDHLGGFVSSSQNLIHTEGFQQKQRKEKGNSGGADS